MPDAPVHIVPGGRPAIAAPARSTHRRMKIKHQEREPFLHEHPVASPRLRGHARPAEPASASEPEDT